jgi:nitrogen fixation/metabolism regulation signal transduction histidine kinase
VTLRAKAILYLVLIHLAFAAIAVFVLLKNRVWLLAVEAVLLVSVLAGIKLLSNLFGPLELIRAGTQFLKETDFGTRFREVGQPEMDELVRVYNQMADGLREERIRAREQHHFLEKIIKASPSGIITFDFDERIAMVNPAAERLLQMHAAELAGKKLAELANPLTEALGSLAVGEARVIPLQGRRRLKCQKSYFLERGFPCHFILLEELTEELRRSEKAAYEKLIRMMSHEINNSIGASGSLLESCLNYKEQLREADRPDFETALTVARSRLNHLDSFTRSFVDVIRLPQPELRPCDLRELLEDIAFLMKPECERRRIRWAWEVREALEPVAMDKNQMEQVFVNVLKNAVEAIGENGTITIRLGKKAGRGYVTVEDTGCGISAEVRANLFTPFFSTKKNGQGLGLTVVQEILTRHHFDFSLEALPGQPTQFSIYF